MDLRSIMSDDQIAIVGCFFALGACGLFAMVTYHFGPAGKNSQPSNADSLKFPTSKTTSETADSRKAA